jgi:hypothetical protein
LTDATPPLTFTLRAFYAPKDGSTDAQYEDAWAATEAGEASGLVTASSELTVAVSDGASAAIFARDWARRLVAAFTTGELGSGATDKQIAGVAVREGALWRTEVETKATSWHAQEKLQTGSAATLLVLTLSGDDRKWSAFAVGDVCLFIVRGGKLKYAFPVPKSTGFDDRPALLSTEARAPFPTVKRFGNTLEPGRPRPPHDRRHRCLVSHRLREEAPPLGNPALRPRNLRRLCSKGARCRQNEKRRRHDDRDPVSEGRPPLIL